jgi:hypothetical protein
MGELLLVRPVLGLSRNCDLACWLWSQGSRLSWRCQPRSYRLCNLHDGLGLVLMPFVGRCSRLFLSSRKYGPEVGNRQESLGQRLTCNVLVLDLLFAVDLSLEIQPHLLCSVRCCLFCTSTCLLYQTIIRGWWCNVFVLFSEGSIVVGFLLHTNISYLKFDSINNPLITLERQDSRTDATFQERAPQLSVSLAC